MWAFQNIPDYCFDFADLKVWRYNLTIFFQRTQNGQTLKLICCSTSK
jgi:hypothetical protein